MKLIGTDEEVINYLTRNNSLISSIVYEIKIYEEKETFSLSVDVYFKLAYTKADFLLKFKRVKQYYFSWDEKYSFYNVEYLKFLKTNDSIYLSLDPDEGVLDVSDDDKDIIVSKSVEGYLIDRAT